MRYLLVLFFVTLSTLTGFSQSPVIDTVFVSTSITTVLIFPKDVILFDIGSEDFGGQKNTNLLRLKAVSEDVPPTNVLVKYGDDIFHGTLAYKAKPKQTFIDFRKTQSTSLPNSARISKQDSIKNLEKEICQKRLNLLMSDKKIAYRTLSVMNEQLGLALTNMRTDGDNVFLKFLVVNSSKLDYDIDFAEFIYRDPLTNRDIKGGYDRKNVYPIVQTDVKDIEAKKEQFIGYAIPRFALSRKGELQFVLREKSGSRILEITIPFIEILDAEALNN